MKITYKAKSNYKFKNNNGSSKKSPNCPNCGSWIRHWKKISQNTSAGLCAVDGCNREATDGAHVNRTNAIEDDYNNAVWILPLCHDHNMKTDELQTKKDATFVWSNVKETCGK